jgi:hypothetical protein
MTTDDMCATRPIVVAQAGVDHDSDSSHGLRGGQVGEDAAPVVAAKFVGGARTISFSGDRCLAQRKAVKR